MYKIYINDTPLILANTTEVSTESDKDGHSLIARYVGKHKFLFHYIDMLEKGKRFESVTLYADDEAQLFQDFLDQYRIVEAAGGLVFNKNGEVLFIYRRGTWDLPKGKIDPGETKEAAAIREVQEETGIQQITLQELFSTTYHTYRENKQRILKRTYWFVMETPEMELTPQAEENIEKAVWWDVQKFLSGNSAIYKSLREVLEKILKQKS